MQDGLPPARLRAMFVIVLGIAMSVLDTSIVNLALPGIARDLQASAARRCGWSMPIRWPRWGCLLPCAMLGDLVGYRRVYLSGLALFTGASLGCVLADSLPTLAFWRAVQGLGSGNPSWGECGAGAAHLPSRLLGRGVALNSVVVATAAVVGPSVSAVILSLGPWPWLFALNLPLGLLVLWLGYGALPHNATARPQGVGLSWPDVLMNMLMFGLVFLGADMLGRRVGRRRLRAGWPRGWRCCRQGLPWGGVSAAPVALPVPLFPVDLLRIPVFRLSMCTSVGAFAAQMLAYVGCRFSCWTGWAGRRWRQACSSRPGRWARWWRRRWRGG